MFEVIERRQDGVHEWVAISCTCDLANPRDELVRSTAGLVRNAYGEDVIVEAWLAMEPDPEIAETFTVDHLVAGFRMGLPNPASEGNKPPQLTNYRSESAEMLARGALACAFESLQFLIAPQGGKLNPNQPILGFDGWAIRATEEQGAALVLVQVKATSVLETPPPESSVLAEECKRLPRQKGPIARVLSVMAKHLPNGQMRSAVLRMLTRLGSGELPALVVAPVLIRGVGSSALADLAPIVDVTADFHPAAGCGASVSLGVDLNEFGRKVMDAARAA